MQGLSSIDSAPSCSRYKQRMHSVASALKMFYFNIGWERNKDMRVSWSRYWRQVRNDTDTGDCYIKRN